MDARPIRLGDVIDDYCPRCRLLLNHDVTSLTGTAVAKVTCRTCFNTHDYRHAEVPPKRSRKTVETKKLFAGIGEISPDIAGMRRLMGDEKLMSYASGVFQMNCAQCHAKDGGGINGVNLTDNHYKNVKVMPDIITVITAGANNGAMPAWRNNFSEKERVLIAAYVANLRGTTPARGREAEGVEIPAWPE